MQQEEIQQIIDGVVAGLATAPALIEAIALLEVDNHIYGTRPCSTCKTMSRVLNRRFGCEAKQK